MKKSNTVVLGALFIAAVSSCGHSEPEWTDGRDEHGRLQDTVMHGSVYRSYNHGWYPVYHGMVCPGYYSRPYSAAEISRPGFAPKPVSVSAVQSGVHTGGFGSSAHTSGGGAGE